MSEKFAGYALYYSTYCPFCIRVTQALKRLGIELEMRNVSDAKHKNALVQGGGKATVPCLLHPDGRWQYESADIIAFLEQQV